MRARGWRFALVILLAAAGWWAAPILSGRGGASDVAGARNLSLDEARGGHTLSRHVGRTERELRERVAEDPDLRAASTFDDRATAERVVGSVLDNARASVSAWARSPDESRTLRLRYRGDGRVIGRKWDARAGAMRECRTAVVVLRRAARGGFVVLTAYPD